MRESGRIVWIRGLRVRRWQRVRSWDWRCGLRGWLGSGKRARRLRSDWHASRIPGRSFGQTVLRDFPTAVTDIRKRKHSAVLFSQATGVIRQVMLARENDYGSAGSLSFDQNVFEPGCHTSAPLPHRGRTWRNS